MNSTTATLTGKFIVIEGGNGSGKSTVIRELEAYLVKAGHSVVVTREPGGTMLGEHLRDAILTNTAACDEAVLLMLCAARAQHVRELILPALARGQYVLCDRFEASSIAFQHYGSGMSLASIKAINEFATGGLKPDRTIILDIDIDTGSARIAARAKAAGKAAQVDRFEEEHNSFQERVRGGYLAQAKDDPERFRVIDADQSLADVAKAVSAAVDFQTS